jgi:hypothetical protein
MKRYFNTEEKALEHLEYRRSCAYSRIEKRGDKILGDASFVYKNKSGKWVVFIQILTESMMKDIEEIQTSFDPICLIPLSPAEKYLKREKKLHKIKKKYKTLDVEKYTKLKSHD